MNVTKLINFVSLFVFGRNDPTAEDRETYLNYLNLADDELFEYVKNSKRALEEIDLFFEPDLNYAPLPENYIAEIYAGNAKLKYSEQYNLDNNGDYYFLNGNIYIKNTKLLSKTDPADNTNKRYITLIVTPMRKELVEAVSLPEPIIPIQTVVPFYPASYHLGLVHGAVYYLFLSNKGFTEKIKYASDNWEKVKKKITAYYLQDK